MLKNRTADRTWKDDFDITWINNMCHMLRFGAEYPSRGDPPIRQ
jgi:hypothetical protein